MLIPVSFSVALFVIGCLVMTHPGDIANLIGGIICIVGIFFIPLSKGVLALWSLIKGK